MTDFKTIDACGLACPQPVVLTKKALQAHGRVTVVVDNTTAVENIKRLAGNMHCAVEVLESAPGKFQMNMTRDGASPAQGSRAEPSDAALPEAAGPRVFAIASATMGNGSDELGALLMRAFIQTVGELDNGPDIMVFYNAGVRFTVQGSEVLAHLEELLKRGVRILVCGTCLDYFHLTDDLRVGMVSNMYDIATVLSTAGRIVMP
jgi:selenium metabolism protein YedF